MPFSRMVGALRPSIEPMLMTRAGSSGVAAAASSGVRSRVRKNSAVTFSSSTLRNPDSGNAS